MKTYIDAFADEAYEHLEALNRNILILESDPQNVEVVNEMFRTTHTLKGSSSTMGFVKMATLAHEVEGLLDVIIDKRTDVDSALIELLLKCVDAFDCIMGTIAGNGTESGAEICPLTGEVTAFMKARGLLAEDKPVLPAKAVDKAFNEYEVNLIKSAERSNMKVYNIRVVLDKGCLMKAARAYVVFSAIERIGEIIKTVPFVEDIEGERFDFEFTVTIVTVTSQEEITKRLSAISEIETIEISEVLPGDFRNDAPANTAELKRERKTVRVEVEKLDALLTIGNDLKSVIARFEGMRSDNGEKAYSEALGHLEKISEELHDILTKVRRVPVAKVFNRFLRMVRETSIKLGKNIELVFSGEDTELDKMVADELGEPLLHILRNSIDHGIEEKEVRKREGKPEKGLIRLNAFLDGGYAVVEVEDDGSGIDVGRVKREAVASGKVSGPEADKLSDNEIIEFVFEPYFSTSAEVTEISGRGVGLDVVKASVERFGGKVDIVSTARKGTKITLTLPQPL